MNGRDLIPDGVIGDIGLRGKPLGQQLLVRESGDQQGAVEDTTIALQKYPFYGRAYAVQGLAEFRAGDKEIGCKDMRQAYDLGFEQAKEYINQYCN